MPIYDFQCQRCGNIEDDLVPSADSLPTIRCSMGCFPTEWKKYHVQLFASAERLKSDNERFPHATNMREPCVTMTKDGPVLGTRRVIAKSRTHMEELMRKHDVVYYDAPANGGVQGIEPKVPDHLKDYESHPSVRKYKDLVKEGKIPTQMVLSEDDLKERFNA